MSVGAGGGLEYMICDNGKGEGRGWRCVRVGTVNYSDVYFKIFLFHRLFSPKTRHVYSSCIDHLEKLYIYQNAYSVTLLCERTGNTVGGGGSVGDVALEKGLEKYCVMEVKHTRHEHWWCGKSWRKMYDWGGVSERRGREERREGGQHRMRQLPLCLIQGFPSELPVIPSTQHHHSYPLHLFPPI